jgi:hypothetical protein
VGLAAKPIFDNLNLMYCTYKIYERNARLDSPIHYWPGLVYCITHFYCTLVELHAKKLRAFVRLFKRSEAERLRASCRSILAPFICIYQSVPPNDPLSLQARVTIPLQIVLASRH